MPLVIPGITSGTGSSDGLKNEWMTKLMGKKLVDGEGNHDSFPKSQLPKDHRVIEGDNTMMTMDHKEDRLNVHVDPKDGTVRNVKFG